ncbi:MAG: acyl-CoA dehydrogenase [Deltaproteobacteria bacterium]|nr:acyl-CoA dehydrogenase [Candidatus Zymogenaceae bacterium]
MYFQLTDEQKMILDMTRKFAEEELKPIAEETDREHKFPTESVKKMAELGLMGVVFPEEYGGAGMDYVSYSLAIEEISRHCASTGVVMSAHTSLGTGPIYYFGTEEQKKKFLTPLARGEKIGCFGMTEANAGSDSAGTRTTAKLDGDHYIVNGTKNFITNGREADTAVVLVRTGEHKHKGLSMMIMEKSMEGYSVGKVEDKLGIVGSSTTELIFEDVKVPKGNLLGSEGEGFKIGMHTLDSGRIGIASQALGIARGSLEESIEFAKTREQFGQAIAEFQAIQWMIADMATRLDAARLLTWRAAMLKDKGDVRFSKEAAMAKLFASETAMWAATKAIQVHGGYGYTKEYPVERYFRDAKITEIYEGTSEIQRLVISSSLLRQK